MNRLWGRMALSYVVVFFLAVSIPIVIFSALDALNILLIEDLPFGRIQELFALREQRGALGNLPGGLIDFLITSSIIGITAGALVSRQVAKPISEMADAARRIGEKDFEIRLEVRGTEEINLLADAFNEMAAGLAETEQLRQNLLADVSHELRTPLTVLEGQLRGALDNVMELNEEDLANLYSQTHHLIRLVDELHELAQAEAKKLPMEIFPTEIAPLLTEVADIFQSLAQEQDVQLKLELAADLPQVNIDSYRLRQSLHNLLVNSLRHTPAGGFIYLRAVQKESLLVIEVEDTGEGIEPVHLPHIFDRFYRLDSSRTKETGGTGLGLAIVKATVEAQGGTVTAHSEGLRKGATFSINFSIDYSMS